MDGCPDVWHKAYAHEGNRLLTGRGSDEYPNGTPLALFYPLVVSGNRGWLCIAGVLEVNNEALYGR